MIHYKPSIRETARSGMALVMVILLLTVTSLIIGTMVRGIILEHRQFRLDVRAAQTRWQADAGLQFALAQLQQNPDYTGENWSPQASPLSSTTPALQSMETSIRISEEGDLRKITVLAQDRPADGPVIRIRREQFWNTLQSSLSALEAENSRP